MSQLARDRANAAQRQGSDPTTSAFVGASAGSGKTKLLTDRLLRLMLGGARPERIQCLTFTKAAAAEMALRLHRTLGRWVTLDEAALTAELLALSVTPSDEARLRARALFATVLDLPGGMRIGTIHAFCQSLLRRFPLEASLSPHFTVADEREAQDALTEAREDMLGAAHADAMRDALGRLAGLTTAGQFHGLVVKLLAQRERLAGALALGAALPAAQRRALRVLHASADDVLADAATWVEADELRAAAERIVADGSPKCQEKAARILAWLDGDASARRAGWALWRAEFLTASGEPRAAGGFVNERLAKMAPTLRDTMLAEVERVVAIEDARRGCDMAALSDALLTLAVPVLDGYARRKDAAGLLDYDDLIGRSSGLLVDPGAAWVLYKLDGGLDHLLLDEVQDTAPAQWRIAHALTAEFFAGQGAVDGAAEAPRTVFAVGDRKQSIFSFQGADATEFDRSRAVLGQRVAASGGRWAEPSLNVSFRSVAPVLDLVDAVFANPAAASGVCEPGSLHHESDRAGQAGAVELWPLAQRPPVAEPAPWTVPDRNQGLKSPPQVVAEALAEWIANETDGHVMLESHGRPLRAGDVMVLVRGRGNDFQRVLVRELKARGVPVAGLDRMALTEQPAVQDLLALADALLLPSDDLQFACFLTSPLGDLSDDSLMALALDRPGRLWEALRARAGERADWAQAWDVFAGLLARVDYANPHALLSEALGPLGGRARLFARLGAEAGEPVDELLNAALAYGRAHPPSLQGFLHWLRRSGAEVKREQEAAGGVVRVMTVHGAKGLQAPLVILPDTTALPPSESGILWATDPETRAEVPLWAPRKEMRCAEAARLLEAITARQMEEYNRLLYVALTRAEDRLVVCGWEPKGKLPDTSWYALVRAGFVALGAEGTDLPGWEDERIRHAAEQTAKPDRIERSLHADAPAPLPSWAGTAPLWHAAPPPAEPPIPRPLAPSRPEGVALGPVPAADSPLRTPAKSGGLQRGRLVHALLQHLPELPPERRAAAALAWLDRPGHGLEPGEAARLAGQVLALLDHPDLAPLFGPDSRAEVPLSGMVAGQVVGGLVDRLAVLPEAVLIADYKTNRRPPADAAGTPVMYLRQMAAYRAVLRAVFPDRPVKCVLVWTETASPFWLPEALLDAHGLTGPDATTTSVATNP